MLVKPWHCNYKRFLNVQTHNQLEVNMTIDNRLLTCAFIFSLLFINACAVNPATGRPDLVMMSESTEIKKGKDLHEKILKSMPIYQDEALAKYVNDIGQKVAKNSHRPNIKYFFTIIDAPDINAFALPGGYIYINRGLLAYLDSEAQLAAVLAHEVAHVTARHVIRQDTAKKGTSILTIASVISTGSGILGDVTNMLGTAAVKGYGREMELEADGFGAEYLVNSGYDPHAMVETIGVLKDHEKFSRYRAKTEGKKIRSYHGVFSTHPRNDIRLKEVIAKAGTLPDNQINLNNKDQYRKHPEGLVFGINYDAKVKERPLEKGRYLHKKLGFSLLYPDEWEVHNMRQTIIAKPKDKTAEISLMVARVKSKQLPSDYLRSVLPNQKLTRSEDFSQFGLIGHTAIAYKDENKPGKRVAVIFQGSRAYLLAGTVIQAQEGVDYDKLFLKSIRSFRPERVQPKKRKSKTIHYVKANDKTTIEALAKHIKLGVYTEQHLRLINGLYPRKKVKAGEWIKIVK